MGIEPRDPQRPRPLELVESLVDAPGQCREVPVRRTFIEYGSEMVQHGGTTPGRKALRSAPASVSVSLRDIFKSWEAGTSFSQAPERQSPVRVLGRNTSPSTASSRGAEELPGSGHGTPLTEICYCLSPTSARAAGFCYFDKASRSGDGSDMCELEGVMGGSLSTASLTSLEMISGQEGPHLEQTPKPTRWTEMDSSSSDDSDEEDEGLCPRFYENAPLPSVGSASHGLGTCKRCCFFPKGRCNNGEACEFCHFAHGKRKNKSKAKKKRRKRRQQELLLQQHQQQRLLKEAQLHANGLAACGGSHQMMPGFHQYWPTFVPVDVHGTRPRGWH
mmetsp:Transcript_58770/g.137199  ORF Transcript_58770/g.137199 Transcript_58770/m.137199 type:complete len:332 (-) Transcript_58770:99-1094(-)